MIDASRGLTIILYFEFCEFAGAGDDWMEVVECRQFRGKGTRVSPQHLSEDKSSDINRNVII